MPWTAAADALPGRPPCQHSIPSGSFNQAKEGVVQRFEREFIENALKEAKGVVLHAAKNTGMDPKNLYKKMKKYQIRASDYKK